MAGATSSPQSFSGIAKMVHEFGQSFSIHGMFGGSIKNTFIHFNMSPQPDKPRRGFSGPAAVLRTTSLDRAHECRVRASVDSSWSLSTFAASSTRSSSLWADDSEGTFPESLSRQLSRTFSSMVAGTAAKAAVEEESASEAPEAAAPCGQRVLPAPPVEDVSEEADPCERLPSKGAVLHSSGACRPCAHNWRAAGCSNGEDCSYCHSCSLEDYQMYRRRSRAAKRFSTAPASTGEGLLDNAVGPELGLGHASSERPPQEEGFSVPSRGSVGHEQGTCRPCAHSWKPAGCSKGWDCEFCHTCTQEDFFKYRKKKKAMREAYHSSGGLNGRKGSTGSTASSPTACSVVDDKDSNSRRSFM